jgi:hypothetical protein
VFTVHPGSHISKKVFKSDAEKRIMELEMENQTSI